MPRFNFTYQDLPTHALESFGRGLSRRTAAPDDYLLESIDAIGILCPIAVFQVGNDRYRVIDGNDRLLCAERLGLATVPVQIYPPPLDEAGLERLRYILNSLHTPWPHDALDQVASRIGRLDAAA